MQTSLEGKVLFVIPCFNEEQCIAKVNDDLAKAFPRYDRLVIDDGSSDNSATAASRGATVVQLPINLGIGGAVQTGILYAKDNHYDFCIQVDGDGQHPVEAIQLVINKYLENATNLTVGSRFLASNQGFRSTFVRRIGISIIRVIIRWITGQRITDPTSGLRLMDRRAIEIFSQDYPPDFPEPISLAIAFESGLSMQEAHVTMKQRTSGSSSISGVLNLSYMIRVCAYLVAVRLRRFI